MSAPIRIILRALAVIAIMVAPTAHAQQSVETQVTKRILVAGATGQSGKLIVTALLEKGFTVRAMSRSAERAASLGDGVEPAEADVTDPSSLSSAMIGVDAVLSAIGGRRPIGSNGFEAVDWEGNRALIDA
ncbi:MAG: NAD(P)H-binding protein, partial [Rhodospirillaceae bacterium]|nr:NAD(P)H-binding protein [Rhodospirillaceae bacterium]